VHAPKCVIVVDNTVGIGLLSNAVAVLSMTLGKLHPDLVGEDLPDASGRLHSGLIRITLPVLAATPNQLVDIARQAGRAPSDRLSVVGFSEIARRERTYDAYAAALAATEPDDLRYLGLGLYGDRALVSSMSGSLRLVR